MPKYYVKTYLKYIAVHAIVNVLLLEPTLNQNLNIKL